MCVVFTVPKIGSVIKKFRKKRKRKEKINNVRYFMKSNDVTK
jgi:hypothetical protein